MMAENQKLTDEDILKLERLAEEYCDKPRCHTISRVDKMWHKMKAAYIAGYMECLEEKSKGQASA